jgi:phenylacetate-coenzyme A ligase PaaK-like adenylate-forming protein
VLALARYSPVLGHPIPTSIKNVLLSTDNAPQAIIQTLEKTWGCKVFNHLGMTEMGLGGGVDCQAHHGMHMREADLFFEIIDPISGMVLPDGDYGEVVFTTLTREGMPLIRYKTGDISRFLLKPCPCKTTLKTMDWFRYRYKNTLKFEQGLLTMADLDEVLFSLPPVLDFWVEVLNQHPILLSITVFVNRDDFQKSEIDTALRTIPTLENALTTDGLKLYLDLKIGLPDYFGSLAKRKIHFKNKL